MKICIAPDRENFTPEALRYSFYQCKHTIPACKRSPDRVTTDSDSSHLIASYYTHFVDLERMKG